MSEVKIPIDMYGWGVLRHIDSKFLIRTSKIERKKQRITDFDGHAVDEVVAEGGVRIKPKRFDFPDVTKM